MARLGQQVHQIPGRLPGVILADHHHALRLAAPVFQLFQQFLREPEAIQPGPEIAVIRAGVTRLSGGIEECLEFMAGNGVNSPHEYQVNCTLVRLGYFLGDGFGLETRIGERGQARASRQSEYRGPESAENPQAVIAAPHGCSLWQNRHAPHIR